jgi:hypothetical protein
VTRSRRTRRPCSKDTNLLAVTAFVLAVASTAPMSASPEREAVVVLPQGIPVRIEDATFFEDGALMVVMVRNSGLEPVRVSMRVIVFDERLRLKGGAAYCVGELVQPGTRLPVTFPLEVKAVSTRDRYVVLIDEARTARRVYQVHEPLAEIVTQARKAAGFESGRLSSDQRAVERPGREHSLRPPDPLDIPACSCECRQAYAVAEHGCGTQGLAGFTCSPLSGSCSMGFSCKPSRN